MSYISDLRALYAQAAEQVKTGVKEQGIEARGMATRRAATMGRYGQPVGEWTYSDIEKGMASALASRLGSLYQREASDIASLRAADKEAKASRRAGLLSSIFGLAGSIAGGPVGAAAGAGLAGLFSKKAKPSGLQFSSPELNLPGYDEPLSYGEPEESFSSYIKKKRGGTGYVY